MARPMRKITKRDADIIYKHRIGAITRQKAKEKLGMTSDANFKTLFYHATMAAN